MPADIIVDVPGDAGPALDGVVDLPPPPDSTVDLPPVPGEWVTIQAGSFWMGSPPGAACLSLLQYPSSETSHRVTLTRAFEMQTTEVTQSQYLDLIGSNPSTWNGCGLACPVDNVNWHDAANYCNELSRQQGHALCYRCEQVGDEFSCRETSAYEGDAIYACPGFRLPTDAEWEYAYRADTTTDLYNGEITHCEIVPDPNATLIAWYTPDNAPHPVGNKLPNAWGLYDMAGNLWEWCHDWGQESLGTAPDTDPVVGSALGTGNHVMRGGSWNTEAWELRAARRIFMDPSGAGGVRGFRCVRSRTNP